MHIGKNVEQGSFNCAKVTCLFQKKKSYEEARSKERRRRGTRQEVRICLPEHT